MYDQPIIFRESVEKFFHGGHLLGIEHFIAGLLVDGQWIDAQRLVEAERRRNTAGPGRDVAKVLAGYGGDHAVVDGITAGILKRCAHVDQPLYNHLVVENGGLWHARRQTLDGLVHQLAGYTVMPAQGQRRDDGAHAHGSIEDDEAHLIRYIAAFRIDTADGYRLEAQRAAAEAGPDGRVQEAGLLKFDEEELHKLLRRVTGYLPRGQVTFVEGIEYNIEPDAGAYLRHLQEIHHQVDEPV